MSATAEHARARRARETPEQRARRLEKMKEYRRLQRAGQLPRVRLLGDAVFAGARFEDVPGLGGRGRV